VNDRQVTPVSPHHDPDGPIAMTPTLRLRPVAEHDLGSFRRLRTDADFFGLDWNGFRDVGEPAKRFAEDGFLGGDIRWLVVETASEPEAVALVNWRTAGPGSAGSFWEIGIVVVPERRGQGCGWRAQALLCDYLFAHTVVPRIQATTRKENVAEQKALVKAGFQFEGIMRSCTFCDGAWRDALLYSRLRSDPSPAAH
jgi:ribosomal-protein-alanine N-acetyltransferase